MKNPMTVVAAFGLALGGVFGMIGTVVTQRNLQAASWGIDGVGLVVATALLALKFFRRGNDVVAAGFLVFAIGEGVMLSGTATTLAGSVRSFAAGRPMIDRNVSFVKAAFRDQALGWSGESSAATRVLGAARAATEFRAIFTRSL